MAFDYHAVPGDYQYRAMHSGHRVQRFWHAGKLSIIDRLVRPHVRAGSRLLEIGCGAGNLLLQATAAGSYPVAVDLSMRSLAFVRSRLEARLGPDGPRGFGCTQAVGEQLPLADGSFDWVLLSEVIEHLPAPHLAIREASRVLRSGGKLLVTTPNYRSLWPVVEWTVDLVGMAPRMAGAQHISRFHRSSLRRALGEAGLSIEYFGSIYGLSPFLAWISTGLAKRQLGRELDRCPGMGMIMVAVALKG